MDKSKGIENKLGKLADENKIQGLFLDEESIVSIILDLETIEYKGVYLKYSDDGTVVEINTAISSLKVNDNGQIHRGKLDDIVRASIDKAAISKFNINKLDEDYFKEVEESLDEKIIKLNYIKTEKIYYEVEEALKEIDESDYDYDLIKEKLKKFDIKEKSNHYILERYMGINKIKYNTSKSKFTIKNNYDFKEKINLNDDIDGFDETRFIEAIKEIKHKREYHKARLELDDGIDEDYPSYATGTGLIDKELDLDND
ncbi:hypothetical protein [Anaerococcus nagyae]|jgi:hypothetical protein|uniref:hypothetical protein n=1 Tax=Anaerococcus nagyae TaxID=1755241 RepID=UPI001AE2C77C|nr:hypothetical protein [Anaerococcus nagyae]MBP2070422.1 hypothetical protein [Anaerococcus nagyae]